MLRSVNSKYLCVSGYRLAENVRSASAAEVTTHKMAASRKTSSCTTYHELQTTESRGLFSCLLCLQPSFSSRPLQLDCRHTFCDRCLQAYHRLYAVNLGGGKPATHTYLVQCPTCRQVTQVEPNRAALSSTQSQSSGNGSHSDILLRKMSIAVDAANQRCDACLTRRRVEVADFYCNKCSLNLCNSCKAAHDLQILFNEHSVIHISNKVTASFSIVYLFAACCWGSFMK